MLTHLSSDPEMTLRELAIRIGITERAASRIVAELSHEGYLTVRKVGRRNTYEVQGDVPLRRPEGQHVPIAALLDLVRDQQEAER